MPGKVNLSIEDMKKREMANVNLTEENREQDYSDDEGFSFDYYINTIEETCDRMEHEKSRVEYQSLIADLYQQTVSFLKEIRKRIKEISPAIEKGIVTMPLMKIERVGEIVKFQFNDNLPHAVRYDKYTKRFNYEYDTQEYYSWCSDSVDSFFEKNGVVEYREKCMVLFVSYYDSSTNPMDHDNIDVKYFIDGAIRRFISGDGPFSLSHSFIGLRASESCTEVYLGREEDIVLLMQRLIQLNK